MESSLDREVEQAISGNTIMLSLFTTGPVKDRMQCGVCSENETFGNTNLLISPFPETWSSLRRRMHHKIPAGVLR